MANGLKWVDNGRDGHDRRHLGLKPSCSFISLRPNSELTLKLSDAAQFKWGGIYWTQCDSTAYTSDLRVPEFCE